MPIITLNGAGKRRRCRFPVAEPQQRQTGLSPQQTLSKCMMQSHQVENPYDVHGTQPIKRSPDSTITDTREALARCASCQKVLTER